MLFEIYDRLVLSNSWP